MFLETCNDEQDCENEAKCTDRAQNKKSSKFCSCKRGTYGDKCEKVHDCLDGKYKNCESSGGTCKFGEDKELYCNCNDDAKKLDERLGYCRGNYLILHYDPEINLLFYSFVIVFGHHFLQHSILELLESFSFNCNRNYGKSHIHIHPSPLVGQIYT